MSSCLLDLRNWLYDLPPELRIDRKTRCPKVPQVYILQMVHQTTHILLVKPFAAAWRLQSLTDGVAPQAQEHVGLNRADEMCYRAAEEICAIARQYRQVFGSFRRSPITATHCMLSAALVLLRPASQEIMTAKTRNSIQECLITLEELSLSWRTAKMILDSLLKLCQKRLHSDSLSSATEASSGCSDGREHLPLETSNDIADSLWDEAMINESYGLFHGSSEDFDWTDAQFDLYAPLQQLDAELQTLPAWPNYLYTEYEEESL
jgi:hypothetical protein